MNSRISFFSKCTNFTIALGAEGGALLHSQSRPSNCRDSGAVKRRHQKHLNPFRTLLVAVSACCVFFHRLFPAAIRVTRMTYEVSMCACESSLRMWMWMGELLVMLQFQFDDAFAIQCAPKDEPCLIHPSAKMEAHFLLGRKIGIYFIKIFRFKNMGQQQWQ